MNIFHVISIEFVVVTVQFNTATLYIMGVIRPILLRNEFVVKNLFKILYWNSRNFVSTRTLNGNLFISCQSKPEYRSVNFFCAVGVLSYFARIFL